MADIQGGAPLPVSQAAGPVQGSEAIPVYVTDEAVNPGAMAGPAVRVYAVTDADIASGKYKVKGGQAVRVMISRNAGRGVSGGPVIAVRKVGGPGIFS